MFDFLYHLSDTSLFFVIGVFTIIAAVLIVTIVMKVVPHELRYRDNPVLGNIGALISIIYGVLVGFAALYLLNVNDMATDVVQQEASAAAHLVRDAKWLKAPLPGKIKDQVKHYLTEVITVEWPQMQYSNDDGQAGDLIIEQMDSELRGYHSVTNADFFIIRNLSEDIKSLYDARQKRIQLSHFSLSSEMWVVIIIGTILAVVINCLFAMNMYMHLMTVSFVALMAASMLYLLISLDRPFTGQFGVDPAPLQSVLTFIEKTG